MTPFLFARISTLAATAALAALAAAPAVACIDPPPEGPPPIIFWCRPVPWGGCLPSPAGLPAPPPDGWLLGIGGFTTKATAAGDSCATAVSPQNGTLADVRSLRLIDARSNAPIAAFPYAAVPESRRLFGGNAFFGRNWFEFRAKVTENVPAGIPLILVFEATNRNAAQPPVPVIGNAKILPDGRFEHLAMAFAEKQSCGTTAGGRPPLGPGDILGIPQDPSGGGTCDTFCCGVCTCCANGTGSDCCNKCEDHCNTITSAN
jgi:hypothetical protein